MKEIVPSVNTSTSGLVDDEKESPSNTVRLSRQLLNSALLEEVDTDVSKLLSRMLKSRMKLNRMN